MPHHALVLIKPDAFERGIVESLTTRLLVAFRLNHIQDVVITEELCDKHYIEHINKPFYPGLKNAMVGKRVLAIALRGDATMMRQFCMGIRKEYVDPEYVGPRNVIHCSDSEDAGKREVDLWFGSGATATLATKTDLVSTLSDKKKNVRKAAKIVNPDDFLKDVSEAVSTRFEDFHKLEKDTSKVQFDFENYDFSKGGYPIYGDLMGFQQIGDFQFCGCAAGGDWEFPVFFLVYLDQDGKTLRGYIPKEGNCWNYKTNEALGNDEDADVDFLNKFLNLKGDDKLEYADGEGDQLVDIDKLKASIAARFEVVLHSVKTT